MSISVLLAALAAASTTFHVLPPRPPVIAVSSPAPSQQTLDGLMEEVLRHRDETTRRLAALQFRETERIMVRGQEDVAPLQSYTKEFVWYGRDGHLVREQVSLNGVPDSEPPHEWHVLDDAAGDRSLDRFYMWDGLFRIPFEPGTYFFAGREMFEGREVWRIEYYPRHLFFREGDESDLGKDFDKTSIMVMLVAVEERRLVRWSYRSIGLQFLPLRWLLRVDDLSATMVIDVASDGTWLPRELSLQARASVAPALITVELTRTFDGFTDADGVPLTVSVSRGRSAPATVPGPGGEGASRDDSVSLALGDGALVDVAFHGNWSVPDGRLAGVAAVAAGDSYTPAVPPEVRERLLASHLVDHVDVRARLEDPEAPQEISLINVVRQRPGWGDHLQFLPLFEWSDEYGVTIGGQVSVVELYGADERLSFPLAIGGRDLAAVEFIDDFDGRFLSGVRTSAGYLREVNPHYEEPEESWSAEARTFKRFGKVQVDVEAGWAEVDFQGARNRQVSFGLSGLLDTRRETGLPRNAVYLSGGWRPLKVIDAETYNRFRVDLRGYLGIRRRSTLVLGTEIDLADGALPAYEKYLLGGLTTLRGFEPGEFIGDNRWIASLELRVPVWNPLPVVVIGVNGFWDTGTVWDYGTELEKAKFHNGVGVGAFLMAAVLRLNVDLGYGIGNGWQFHFGSGLRY